MSLFEKIDQPADFEEDSAPRFRRSGKREYIRLAHSLVLQYRPPSRKIIIFFSSQLTQYAQRTTTISYQHLASKAILRDYKYYY
tara:strand:+ start:299 stop:550 length:252 start_codon:yes stop_codon:yes gene_type:complete